MIFIANALVMNGGTTFLVRACSELNSRNKKCAVILLRNEFDAQLMLELEQYAAIIHLSDFLIDGGVIFRAQISAFGPINWAALESTLSPYSGQVHAMGVLGLIFALRLARSKNNNLITVGVYHQNEFLYRPPPFYFAKEAIRLFASIPEGNIIFFNESTRRNYQNFFKKEYSASTITPIGINLRQANNSDVVINPDRIVSVGNLENFKTYNSHVIRIVAELKREFPKIFYDIYGVGTEEAFLRSLAIELDVEGCINFKGWIPYSEFDRTVADARLFVGSGTALIEAAAVGVPALVGIESIETPETYGFLSDIKGFSYNEKIPGVRKQMMKTLIEQIFRDSEFRDAVSRACKAKASEFSVANTVNSFSAMPEKAKPILHSMSWFKLCRMLISFILLAILSRLGWIAPFNERRNQSY